MVLKHIAREQITVDSTSGGKTLTSTTVKTADGNGRMKVVYADIDVQAADMRVTFDGSTAPVASTTGTLWRQGEKYRVWGITNLTNLKLIRESSTSALIAVDYWGS